MFEYICDLHIPFPQYIQTKPMKETYKQTTLISVLRKYKNTNFNLQLKVIITQNNEIKIRYPVV